MYCKAILHMYSILRVHDCVHVCVWLSNNSTFLVGLCVYERRLVIIAIVVLFI